MSPNTRANILVAVLVCLSIAAVIVWSLNNRPPNHRVLPSPDYYTGPMRGASHPDRLVDEDGHVYSTGPASGSAGGAASKSSAGAPPRPGAGSAGQPVR